MNCSNRQSIHYAWIVVGLLWPVALLNYLDRQMLAAMKFSVMGDIPSIGSEADWGRMLGQFKWVYAFLSPVGGYLADRLSRRFTICGSLVVWSAVTWATGQVTTYSGLLWTRSLMGISEAFYIPAALALIADYHTGETRSRAVGAHQMAIYAGVMLGGFSGYLADVPALGWRFAFAACGLVGIAYALPLLIFLRDAGRPGSKPPVVAPGTQPSSAQAGLRSSPLRLSGSPLRTARELFTNGSFVLLVLCFTLPALAGWVVRDWMPAVLKQEFKIGQGQAGFSATFFWLVAAVAGAALGGWLADLWARRRARGRIFVSALGMGLIVPAMFGVGNARSLAVAIAFLALFGLGWGFFDCNNMPILCQIVRPELRATGYGLMNLVSIACGGFADWGFGTMRDAHMPLNIIFGLFAGATLLSIALVLLIRPAPTEPLP